MYWSSKWLLKLLRTFRYCEVHISCFIHVHEISFIRKIRRWNMRSLCSSVRRWARSLVKTVLLIHRVRYTAEFQAVKVYHFPLPGIVDCLVTSPILVITMLQGTVHSSNHSITFCVVWRGSGLGLQSFVPGRSGSFLALHTWK